ncbi:AAA family ATPase [Streptomyces sp. NPDC002537]
MIFAERGAELKILQGALDESVSCGNGKGTRIVLIEGGVACGKSETLALMGERAVAAGAAVLCAVGSPESDGTPFGVLRQLLDSPPFPDGARRGLREAVDGDDRAPVPQRFSAALRDLAGETPVVVSVDDLQYVDVESLHCLAHLVHHARKSRILVLLAQSLDCPPLDPTFDTELLRQPNFRRITLEPLGPRGVASVLAGQPDIPADPGHLAEFHAYSGGNPLLLKALIEDHRLSERCRERGAVAGDVVPGARFGQAVLTCLHRGGAGMRDAATALAVLGGSARAELLGRLAGMNAASAARALHALAGAGLTVGHRFRHPLAGAAVLDGLRPAERRSLHCLAAALLHQEGAPAAEVAAHLLAGHDAIGPWGVAVLREAAEEALADDEARRAIACLELACEGCADDALRAEIRIRLAAITWRINPVAAEERHLSEPVSALLAGRLPVASVGPLAKLLVAHGRLDEARHALGRIKELSGPEEQWMVESECEILMPWTWHAQDTECLGAANGPADARDPRSVPAGAHAHESSLTRTEHFLKVSPLTDTTLAPIVTAVKSLLYSDRVDLADPWCTWFLEESARREAPGWQAVFASLRAEIALRQGRLAAAESHALLAMRAFPERTGNLFVGGPMASLILARTAMGKYDAAARQLNQSVPNALFKTVYGLGYLRARGRYYLATNRIHAALGDFLALGRLAVRWGVDRPVLLPWRSDAAEAWLQLSERDQAERLIAEQLRMSDADNSRIRGVCLRLRATMADVERRPRMLAGAVEALQRSGDRLELARALAALGEAHELLGDSARAAVVKARAWRMAKECGAETLCEDVRPDLRDPRPAAVAAAPDNRAFRATARTKLSGSEKRVAVLAACGYTNREISERLGVTVSTVEQHLTRVYRKLNISRREQLPPDLQVTIGEIA